MAQAISSRLSAHATLCEPLTQASHQLEQALQAKHPELLLNAIAAIEQALTTLAPWLQPQGSTSSSLDRETRAYVQDAVAPLQDILTRQAMRVQVWQSDVTQSLQEVRTAREALRRYRPTLVMPT